ncbi:DNA topoisomerase 3-alpha [Bienertia sinuspersici]
MASRRANSWASGSSSNQKNVGNSNIRCNCGKEALIRTVKNEPNLGMKWVNEHTDMEENQLKFLEKDTVICELEVELKHRNEKIKKLQSKKAKLEEDLKHMKNELIPDCNNNKIQNVFL